MKSNLSYLLKMIGLGVYALILCSSACGKKTFVPVDDNTPVEKEQAAKPKDETPTPDTPTTPTDPTNPTGPTTPTDPTPTVPQNLTARLAINQGSVRDYEGGALSWTMTLDQPLSKPAQIKVNTNTTNYKTNYANPEDFTPAEYSYDGYTWLASANNVVEIPAQKTSIQVRIPLVADGAPEILEEKFQVSFTHENSGEVTLPGYVPTSFEATIIDTDVPQELRNKIDGWDDGVFLVFEKTASGVFKLSGVRTSVKTNEEAFALKQKQLIDGGYQEIIDFISGLLIKPVDVVGQIQLSLDIINSPPLMESFAPIREISKIHGLYTLTHGRLSMPILPTACLFWIN